MLHPTVPLDRQLSIDWYKKLLGNAARQDEEALAQGERPAMSRQRRIRRWLCRNDLFYLLVVALGRRDANKEWLFQRCRELQAEPNGYLDVWAREHYKSTIGTFALNIQDILASHGEDPEPRYHGREVTIGIFSHTKGIATDFLDMIKQEFEANDQLKADFPDVLWQNPQTEAPSWSKSNGITVKRKSNPRECTVEAHGVVDGQPIGKHFVILDFDDLVTEDSVATPDQIAKTTNMWRLATNLGTEQGWKRYKGTYYHLFDTYHTMIEQESVKVRKYPCTKDGTDDIREDNVVLQSVEYLTEKRKDQGPYVFGCQMLLDPVADKMQGFKEEWLRYWDGGNHRGMNIYIIVDPASGKKAKGASTRTTGRNLNAKNDDLDYTVMEVIGCGSDKNFYTLDRIRDRLNLTERTAALFELHRQWEPKGVGYEDYGMQADIEHIEDVMKNENYRFDITPLGGSLAKEDRIKKLVPIYEQGRWYELEGIVRVDYEGKAQNLTRTFIREEYLAFPVCKHDDILDAKARILDPELGAVFPKPAKQDTVPDWMRKIQKRERTFMGR